MNAEARGQYRFSHEAKAIVHERAGNRCEYEGEYADYQCPNPNTNRVNHITGAFEGWLKGADPRDISNPDMNGVMECREHEAIHDAQERLQVEVFKGERVREFPRSGTIYDRNRHHRIKRRRHGRR